MYPSREKGKPAIEKITFRTTVAGKKRLEKAAKKAGTNVADYMRQGRPELKL